MSGKEFVSRQWVIQFVTFNFVGLLNTIIDFVVFSLLLLLGMGSLGAQMISYVVGSINSYMLNRKITFASLGRQSKSKSFDGRELIRFGLLNLMVLVLSLLSLFLLTSVAGLPPIIAKIIVTAITVVVSFYGNRKWVFKKNVHMYET